MRFLSIIFSFLLLVNLATGTEQQEVAENGDRYRDAAAQIKLLGEILRGVNQRYVDDIPVEEFVKAGIDGMLGTLDPYTVYFEPERVGDLEEITKGEFTGVGIEIGLRGKKKELTVISPMEDTPASRIGIRSGDVIVTVNGESTAGFTTADAADRIRGDPGTEVKLTIRRHGFEEPIEYTVVREVIRIDDVAYAGMIDDEIGYIRLVRFSGHAGAELRQALEVLLKNKPRGLILDLRSNPGGLLPAAVEVAEEFLGAGDTIVSTRGRSPRSSRAFNATKEPLAGNIPVAVLVNGGSASASEIVAGALQDHDRALIIGTTTFGKGLVQSVLNLSNGAALKITSARYYTPSGRLIQRDREFDGEDELLDLMQSTETYDGLDTSNVDSTAEKYYTDSGREVFGGGGINPDIVVKPPKLAPLQVEMYRRDLFFTFVDKWLELHTKPDTVLVTGQMLTGFKAFIDTIDFEPPLPGKDQLDALRKIAQDDSLGMQITALLDNLEAELKRKNVESTPETKEFIRQGIDMELASALGGREWRIRASFDDDVQLAEAIAILKDKPRYQAELRGTNRADTGRKEH